MSDLPGTIEWIGDAAGFLRLLDQTRLPGELAYRDCHVVADVWDAIRRLQVRGAPAIGVAAAYGVVLAAKAEPTPEAIQQACAFLATARPTAVNLFWALQRMQTIPAAPQALLAAARALHEDDRATCRAIGERGLDLLRDGMNVLTHCNAGALATTGYGTALAPIHLAARAGMRLHVFVDETRPLLQGARLTAWELHQNGVPCTLICDGMAGQVMKEGRVDLVIVGADRIAANGDAANKIGTYALAVLARHHGIPIYVAAPASTFDLTIADGGGIPIEERAATEITHGLGGPTAPAGVPIYNPAFDVTPARLLSGIITQWGIISPVDAANVKRMVGHARHEQTGFNVE